MEFTMREWLTVIIVLLILGILLDGWRRMRQSKNGSIKMSRKMPTGADKSDIEVYGSELPNGGARVIKSRDDDDARDFTQNLQKNYEDGRNSRGPIKPKIKEQESFGFEREVPMLMESVVEDVLMSEPRAVSSKETLEETPAQPIKQERVEPTFSAEPSSLEPSLEQQPAEPVNPFANEPEIKPEPKPETKPAPVDAPQEVLVINVMAPKGKFFPGEALQKVLFNAGMRYGDMDIFHHYEGAHGEGEVLFSMANMVKPGTFDLAKMKEFSTPGVSFFLSLPTAGSSLDAFNTMAWTAKQLVDFLGGELKDEQRSVMTNQTLEHCRQRIAEFERKRLM